MKLSQLFLLAATVATLSFTAVAAANHSQDDPYVAMCQSTGTYCNVKLNPQDAAKHAGYQTMQLFGKCGDEPNILIMDNATLRKNTTLHATSVWQSPRRDSGYWRMIFAKDYIVANADGKVLDAKLRDLDEENFLEVKSIRPMFEMKIDRFCSAKKGSPIFPNAMGPIHCEGCSDESGMLERCYMDYMNSSK